MDVIIKDMDMPKNCWSCPMIRVMAGKEYCGKTLSDIKDNTIKLPNCPLIEISTPHGRLIDADTLEYELCEFGHYKVDKTEIDSSETIIEAEVHE